MPLLLVQGSLNQPSKVSFCQASKSLFTIASNKQNTLHPRLLAVASPDKEQVSLSFLLEDAAFVPPHPFFPELSTFLLARQYLLILIKDKKMAILKMKSASTDKLHLQKKITLRRKYTRYLNINDYSSSIPSQPKQDRDGRSLTLRKTTVPERTYRDSWPVKKLFFLKYL